MENPHRILLIQLRALGDVILTTPALRVLKRHYPDAAIDFVANPAPAEALTNNPNLSRLLVYPYSPRDAVGLGRFILQLRKNRYDLAVDFLGTPATALMTLGCGAKIRVGYSLRLRRFAYTHRETGYRGDIYNALTKFSLLKSLGIEEEESRTEIFIPPEAEIWAQERFRELGLSESTSSWEGASVIALAPKAKRPARQWLPERFAEVADSLQAKGHRILILWGPGEEEFARSVGSRMRLAPVIAPRASLLQSAALLRRCRLLIGNCGGSRHIAAAVGTATLTVHGPTDPRVWTPPDDPRHVYVRAVSQRMEDVSTAQVLEAVAAMGIL
jgi:ADP-heptose:LPS heptosyltransferase